MSWVTPSGLSRRSSHQRGVDQPRPPGCEKIGSANRYRIRQGAYRILYQVDDVERVIMVHAVGYRRDVDGRSYLIERPLR
ncbi:MAG: type II toxin-antitoxin system RelE/ParE family toxin [Pseudomonadales bacterium]